MGQELARWQPPRTTLSLDQRGEIAKKMLARAILPTDALKAAKRLVGQWPHLKADQPDVFVASVGAVLAQYPAGVVEECCDPRTGAARKIEFLTIRALTEWLDKRLEYHQALATLVPRKPLPAPPVRQYPPEHRATMIGRFAELVAQLFRANREDPITKLRRVARENAEQRLAVDKARALREAAQEQT